MDDITYLDKLHDEKDKVHTLTPRQEWFRRLLDETYKEDENRSLSQQEVYDRYTCDLLKPDSVIYPEWDSKNTKSFEYSSAAAREIRKDFQAIKTSVNTQAVYLSSVNGYKRANEEESLAFFKKRKVQLATLWQEFWEQVDRHDLNGQMRIQLTKNQSDTYDPYMHFRKEDKQ